MAEPMELGRFLDLVDRQGADLARWPSAERGPVRDLLARSAEARNALAAAEAVAASLDRLGVAPPSGALIGRILAALPQPRRPFWPWLAWRAAVALPIALAIGITIGLEVPPDHDDGADPVAVVLGEADLDMAL